MELNTLSPPVCFLFFTVVDIFANNISMSTVCVDTLFGQHMHGREIGIGDFLSEFIHWEGEPSPHASSVPSSTSSATSMPRSRSPHNDDVCHPCRSDRVAMSIMVTDCHACKQCDYFFSKTFQATKSFVALVLFHFVLRAITVSKLIVHRQIVLSEILAPGLYGSLSESS